MEEVLDCMTNSVFIVAEYVKSSQNSTGYFWERLIDHLPKVGLLPKVISDAEDGEYIRSRIISFRLLSKTLSALKLGIKVAHYVRRDSLLMSGTNPEFLMLVLALLKLLIGYRWIVVVSDVFPENTIPARILPSESIRYYIISIIFRLAYKKVDRFVVPGRDMIEVINKKIGHTQKTSFIPYWVDINSVSPIQKSKSLIINKLGWQKKTIFQFFGNMGVLQDIDNILSAIKLTTNENLGFLFIGSGTAKATVENFVKENPTKHVHYYGEIPQIQKSEGLSACDVAIVSLVPGMKGLAVPSKAYFSFAADKPILTIGDLNSELSLIVQDEKVGWTCLPGNPKALADTIQMIATLDLREYSGRPRRLVEEKYAENLALDNLSSLVKEYI